MIRDKVDPFVKYYIKNLLISRHHFNYNLIGNDACITDFLGRENENNSYTLRY